MKKLTAIPSENPLTLKNIGKALSDAINATLNWVFALHHRAAVTRFRGVMVLLIGIWLLLPLRVVPPEQRSQMLVPLLASTLTGDINGMLLNGWDVLTRTILHPVVVQHILALLAPCWLMYRITAIYLADVFERSEEVTRKFVIQAAFGTSYNTIHIRQGKVAEEDQDSPMIQIGGPGYVVVELDSAVLFERPDGTPHVVGPTDRTVIDGFERIRQCFDLRDIIDKQDASARARDGIQVTARDVQYSYSIYRGEFSNKTLQSPYPFDENSAKTMVFKAGRNVPYNADARKHDWLTPMPGKMAGPIGGEIGTFISKRGLSEFLSSVGEPEVRSLADREQKIEEMSQRISGAQPGAPAASNPTSTEFSSRAYLSSLFYQEAFQQGAAKKGFNLNWIGVGTWAPPAQIIPQNHLEAWKLSRENLARGNPQALNGLRNEAKLRELLQIVQKMLHKFFDESSNPDDNVPIEKLLREYLIILENARELYRREGENAIPPEILVAIRQIESLDLPSHDVGL